MTNQKRPFQFTLMQLVWTVVISAVILGIPPFLWLIGVAVTIWLMAASIFLGSVLLVVIGPAMIYWRVVHSLESRHPDWTLSDVAFAIGGTVCFFLGVGIFFGLLLLLTAL